MGCCKGKHLRLEDASASKHDDNADFSYADGDGAIVRLYAKAGRDQLYRQVDDQTPELITELNMATIPKEKHANLTALASKCDVRIVQVATKAGKNLDSGEARLFMERWDAYKAIADQAIGESNKNNLAVKVGANAHGMVGSVGEQMLMTFDANGDGMIGPSEYDAMEASIADEWKRRVDAELKKQAKTAGTTVAALQDDFVQGHIAKIEAKGYVLNASAKECLGQALQRFFICNVGPAPFSIHTAKNLADAKTKLDDMTVTVSQHCLQMAMHWLRNPPEFLSVPELEELVVLSIFHDVYYYDDFTRHAEMVTKLLEPFLLHEVPKAVVGGHLHLKPKKAALQTMTFVSPLEALKQEWVQMDWYLTLVNVKQEATRAKRIGDGVMAPLDFFHHHLGHVFTKGNHTVIETAKAQNQSW